MALDINNLITADIREKLSKKDLVALEESINKSYTDRISEIEKQTSDKFNLLVENLTKKFDEQVNKTDVSIAFKPKKILFGFFNEKKKI